MTNQLPLDFPSPDAPPPEPKRYVLHGGTKDRMQQLEANVVAWELIDGIWWMTGADGTFTGYSFAHFAWLGLRPQEAF